MSLPRPPELLRWSTDESNDTEPLEAKKDTGFLLNEAPPSAEHNFLLRIAGETQEWTRERHDDGTPAGGDRDDYQITAPPPTVSNNGGQLTARAGDAVSPGTGGKLSLEGGDGVGVGAQTGGDVDLLGGDGADTGQGGTVTITGGVGPTSGNGGNVDIDGGSAPAGESGGSVSAKGGDAGFPGPVSLNGGDGVGTAIGGTAVVQGGDSSGTDQNSGTTTIASGTPTGDGSADLILKARDDGGGTGGTLRPPQEYLRCDGLAHRLNVQRRLELSHNDVLRGPVRVVPVSYGGVLPTSAVNGEVALDDDDDQIKTYNGSFWQNISPLVFRMLAASQAESPAASTEQDFRIAGPGARIQHTIPADTLRVGSIVRIRFAFHMTGSSGTVIARYYFNSQLLGGLTYNPSPTGDADINCDADWLFRVAGGSAVCIGNGMLHGHDSASQGDAFRMAATNPQTALSVPTNVAIDTYVSVEHSNASSVSTLHAFSVEVI